MNEATKVMRVPVIRSGPLTGEVTVVASTTGGSAVAGTDYVPVTTNLVFGPRVVSRTIDIPILDDSLSEANETVTLELRNAAGATLGAFSSTTLRILDNDPAGRIALGAPLFKVSETSTAAMITILRTGGTASEVSAQFATGDGTASAGADYTGVAHRVTFGRNELRKTVEIPIIDDPDAEGNETLKLELRDPAGGARLGVVTNAALSLLDDEIAIQFSKAAYLAKETSGLAIIAVIRSGPLRVPVSVDCVTAVGSAVPGIDYKPLSRRLGFAPGVAARFLAVPVLNDTLDDGDRAVHLSLSNPSTNAQLGANSETVVTIADDDAAGTVEFGKAEYEVIENAGRVAVVVRRKAGTASGVTVLLATHSGVAVSGVDFTPITTNLVFRAGEVSKTVCIPVQPDGVREGPESLQLSLSNPGGGAVCGAVSNATLTLQDFPANVEGTYKFNGYFTEYLTAVPSQTIRVNYAGELTFAYVTENQFEGSGIVIYLTKDGDRWFTYSGRSDAWGKVTGKYTSNNSQGTFSGSIGFGKINVTYTGRSYSGKYGQNGVIKGQLYRPSADGFAPADLAGAVMQTDVTSTSETCLRSGLLQYQFSQTNHDFQQFTLPDQLWTGDGTCLYRKTGPDTASLLMSMYDFPLGEVTVTNHLVFLSPNSGTLVARRLRSTCEQTGVFAIQK